MIIPWVGPLPVWTSYFISSVAASAPVADFLIFHEEQKHLEPSDLPANVRMHDLGAGGMAQV